MRIPGWPSTGPSAAGCLFYRGKPRKHALERDVHPEERTWDVFWIDPRARLRRWRSQGVADMGVFGVDDGHLKA